MTTLYFSKSSIARAPDGNGGIYAALKREGILQHMRQNGVSCCHVYCVDNSLVKGTAEYRILIHTDESFLGKNTWLNNP